MLNQTIFAYVVSERARGIPDEVISGALLAQGWKAEDVTGAMAKDAVVSPAPPVEFTFAHLFEGRLGRKQFFINTCLYLISLFFTFALVGFLTKYSRGSVDFQLYIIIAIYLLATPMYISLSARRLHDINSSGWITLIYLFLPLAFIVPILLILPRGTVGTNNYGPEQLDRNFKDTILNT